MIAPLDGDRYHGDWILRDGSGIIFGINGENPFYVEIEVIGLTATPEVHAITIAESAHGSVREDGSTYGVMNVGDDNDDFGLQGFVSFNLSAIPDDATITSATLSVAAGSDLLGDPFGNLGCIYVRSGSYFPLDASDYVAGGIVPVSDNEYCSLGDVNAVFGYKTSVIQSALASDNLELMYWVLFEESNSDGNADMVRFDDILLNVNYTEAP